jgi:hypothetical protein
VLENRDNKEKTMTISSAVALREVTRKKLKGQIEVMKK